MAHETILRVTDSAGEIYDDPVRTFVAGDSAAHY
jgi:hypothetical protein